MWMTSSLFSLLDSMLGEAAPVADIASDFDIFSGMTKVKHQLSSPPQSSQPTLNLSLISARLFHLCEKYSAHCSHYGLSFDMHHWNRQSAFRVPEDVYAYWSTRESWCLGVFVLHCLDIPCVPSQKSSHKHTSSEFCYMQTCSHKVITIPCPALSLTLGWCKLKHLRDGNRLISFRTSHYQIMLLIRSADKVRNDILF